jgi:hypothetical protein
MNFQDIVSIRIDEIDPLSVVGSDLKRDRLIESMRRDGWQGRPLLVVEFEDGTLRALTGSHRYDAAKKAPLADIPCYVISASRWSQSGLSFDHIRILPEPQRVEALRRTGLADAADVCQEEIDLHW